MNGCEQMNRRELLWRSVTGTATLSAMLGSVAQAFGTPAKVMHPLTAQTPHFQARARRIIFLNQSGGVSHVDSFDPKEKLTQDNGKTQGNGKKVLLGSPWQAQARGQSGIMVTELFPHIGSVIDDICLIRSLHGDQGDHFQATLQMHTGSNGPSRPSIGAWLSYGLGTLNLNLPSHVVFAKNKPYAGSQVWDANFLPDYHGGVLVDPGDNPIPNLKPDADSAALQPMELDMLRQVIELHRERRPFWSELAARILSFQTAYQMQSIAPALFDLSQESDAIFDLYGLKRGDNSSYAWQCLMARRMAEQGVRFIELIDTGSNRNWDAHGNIQSHQPLAKAIDKPIAGLIKDLKQRGMLDDTLIVWTTEFGRTPNTESGSPRGRGHHRHVFTCWLAGGGVKGGTVYGSSDDIGMRVADKPVHVHDFHATILHIMGLDHEKLTYSHNGRDFRLTDVHGNVVRDILA